MPRGTEVDRNPIDTGSVTLSRLQVTRRQGTASVASTNRTTAPVGLFGSYGTALAGRADADERPTAARRPDPPRPRPGPDEPSPAVSDDTRQRLAGRPGPAPPAPRHAIAFVLAVGAVAGMVGALRPWETDA